MSEKEKLSWQDLDLEELKRRAGFKDFTKMNALRIASRVWISEKGNSLKKCVERTGKPYYLIGYYLGALKIVADSQLDNYILDAKPNTLLFLALRENLCGKDIMRYEENLPPFIVKAQYVKPLATAIRFAMQGEDFEELKKFPWLIVYGEGNSLFKVGALTKLDKIDKLSIFKDIQKFLELIAQKSETTANGLKIINARNFDEAYREAFKELIENYQFVLEMNEKHLAEDSENKLNENEEDLDLLL
jgi:hypothetical protein